MSIEPITRVQNVSFYLLDACDIEAATRWLKSEIWMKSISSWMMLRRSTSAILRSILNLTRKLIREPKQVYNYATQMCVHCLVSLNGVCGLSTTHSLVFIFFLNGDSLVISSNESWISFGRIGWIFAHMNERATERLRQIEVKKGTEAQRQRIWRLSVCRRCAGGDGVYLVLFLFIQWSLVSFQWNLVHYFYVCFYILLQISLPFL